MTTLTTRQQYVLDLLIAYQREHGFPPTNFELAGLLGCSSPNAAADHLRALEKKGAISITRGVSRGITITQPKPKSTGMEGMKLVLPFPPSVNTYWRSPNSGRLKGRHLLSKRGREYKAAVRQAVIEQIGKLPKASTALVDVDIFYFPPDLRERDLDNFQKALLDSITYASVWVDDKQVKRITTEWGPKVKGGKVEITIIGYIARAGAAA